MFVRTLENLVNHKPLGERFSSFLSVLPPSSVVYCASKPIERVVYCLNIITKSMPSLLFVNQLWFIVPVNSWENSRVHSKNYYTRRIRKSYACLSWFRNSSRILPTSCVVYQPRNYTKIVVYCSRWLKAVFSAFQDVDFDTSLLPFVMNYCHNHDIKKVAQSLVNMFSPILSHYMLPRQQYVSLKTP